MIKYVPEKCKFGNECGRGGCSQSDAVQKNPDAPRYICAHPFDPKMVDVVKEWNKLTKKYPQNSEFELKGIEYWNVQRFELLPTYEASENRKAAIKEGVVLLKEGFKLGYNTESGVGSLVPKDKGYYVISSWCYQHNTISKELLTAEQAVEWLLERNQE